MKYQTKTQISYSELKEALLLDQQVFGERSAEYKVCRYWLAKNDESFIVLKNTANGAVVGYICFLPLEDKVYDRYVAGEIHEYELRSKDILKYESGKTYKCLFCCIILDKDHRDGEAIKKLVAGFDELLISLKRRKIKIERMVADCITDDGVKYVLREGYKFVKKYNGGQIFEKVILKD